MLPDHGLVGYYPHIGSSPIYKGWVAGITGAENRSKPSSRGGESALLLITFLISSPRHATLLIMRCARATNAPKPLLITGSWGDDRTDRDTD